MRAVAALRCGILMAAVALGISTTSPVLSWAGSAAQIDRDATQSLNALYKNNPGAKALADKSVAVLVFPSIVKGGFIIAGQFGDGALRKNGKTVGYYRSLAGSYGFQAGAQAFGYVLFFMDDASVAYLDKSDGWELGTGPSLVVLDEGFRQKLYDNYAAEGGLRVHLRSEGIDGRYWHSRIEDYQNQSVVESAVSVNVSRERSTRRDTGLSVQVSGLTPALKQKGESDE